MCIRTNIWHLIGRLNQTAADGVFPLSVFKPSSSDSADRGRSIIRVSTWTVGGYFLPYQKWHFQSQYQRIKANLLKRKITLQYIYLEQSQWGQLRGSFQIGSGIFANPQVKTIASNQTYLESGDKVLLNNIFPDRKWYF